MNKVVCLLASLFLVCMGASAQVSTVEFGKNRVQFQKFKWKYYQTDNFNTYFSQDGLGLGKYVAQVAETELPTIDEFVEYGLQRRVNIVVYNSFDEMQQSNIGLGIDWQNTGGVTKLVNNKMLVYFDGNHENLRRQIRQGIAKVLVDNQLFGDDLGEFAANQTLLDLPKWLTDGYVEYAGEVTYIGEGETIRIGMDQLLVLFTPGHSPGSVSFYHEAGNFVMGGDVLFNRSIGRTDLPGGDQPTLIKSIQTQLFTLPDDTKVYSGHGPVTTIGFEKMNNPFVKMY